jgi:predicted nucleic acid-binding protein
MPTTSWRSCAMVERIVVNTGPIVALSRAGVTGAVAQMPIEFISPMEIRREIDKGPPAGREAVDLTWVRFVLRTTPLSALAVSSLDDGEAAVIQLALDEQIPTVCIDERKGRRAALAVGLRVTGTLGILGKAKMLGLIPAVRPHVEKMVTGGDWFDAALLARFYAAVGE